MAIIDTSGFENTKQSGPRPAGGMTVAESVFEQLRDEIYSGSLLPGDAIRETRQGVSQTTVRSALLKLEPLGLVVKTTHRGTKVSNPTQRDLANRIDVRIPLDIVACQHASSRMQDSDFQLLEDMTNNFGPAGGSGRADETFHHRIWDSASNELLTQILKQISAPLFAFVAILRRAGFQSTEDRVNSHRRLIDTLRSRDHVRISTVVEEHVRSAYTQFQSSEYTDMRSVALRPVRPPKEAVLRYGGSAPSMHQGFVRWIPAVALVRNAEADLVFANEELDRLTGKPAGELLGSRPDSQWPPEAARQILAYDEFVRVNRVSIMTVDRLGRGRRLTLRFPVPFNDQVMAGALGFDLDALHEAATNLRGKASAAYIEFPQQRKEMRRFEVPTVLLSSYFQALPAIATWKDLRGEMIWANSEYERVTGKTRGEAVGRLPVDNWPEPLGYAIMAHDAIVRRSRAAILTCDRIPVGQGLERVNLRFPVFDDSGVLVNTASLGLSYDLVMLAGKMFDELQSNGQSYVVLPARDNTSADVSSVSTENFLGATLQE